MPLQYTVKSYSLLKNDNKHLTCCDAFSTPTAEVEEGQKILLTRLFKNGSALYDSLDDMAKNYFQNFLIMSSHFKQMQYVKTQNANCQIETLTQ